MIFSLASWAVLSVLGGLLALGAIWSRKITRWRLVSLLGFLASIFVSGLAIFASQGWAHNCRFLLPGHYEIITYTFDSEKITMFLETDFGPKACYIPFSSDEVEKLQKNDEDAGSQFVVDWGDEEGEGQGGGSNGGENGAGEIVKRPPPTHAPKPQEGLQ